MEEYRQISKFKIPIFDTEKTVTENKSNLPPHPKLDKLGFILSKFDDGVKRYNEDCIFHQYIKTIYHNAKNVEIDDCFYEIINNLIITNNQLVEKLYQIQNK